MITSNILKTTQNEIRGLTRVPEGKNYYYSLVWIEGTSIEYLDICNEYFITNSNVKGRHLMFCLKNAEKGFRKC